MLQDFGPIQVIRDILKSQLEIADNRVFIYNQKFTLPTDDGLFIVVQFKNSKPYSSRNRLLEGLNGPVEIQDVSMKEYYSIGIFSRNTEALNRKEEVIMAISSFYAQQAMEKNSFHIARISPVQDLSPLEETALLYRFDVDITVLAWYEKQRAAQYYNQFGGEVDTEQHQNISFTPQSIGD